MFQEFFAGSRFLLLPLVAMSIFLVVFVGLLLWVILGSRAGDFDHLARLPLEDDSGASEGRKR